MSRNQYVDYMDVTGFLPRIVRSSAVCWRGEQLYIKGNPCYAGAPKYLNAAETREYMHVRFGYKKPVLEGKTFDNAVTADVARMHGDKLTITDSGRFIFDASMPVTKMPSGVTESVKYTTGPDGIQKISQIGPAEIEPDMALKEEKGKDVKAKGTGMALGVVAVVVAIGYLMFGRKG